jgi:hypothetical protein
MFNPSDTRGVMVGVSLNPYDFLSPFPHLGSGFSVPGARRSVSPVLCFTLSLSHSDVPLCLRMGKSTPSTKQYEWREAIEG